MLSSLWKLASHVWISALRNSLNSYWPDSCGRSLLLCCLKTSWPYSNHQLTPVSLGSAFIFTSWNAQWPYAEAHKEASASLAKSCVSGVPSFPFDTSFILPRPVAIGLSACAGADELLEDPHCPSGAAKDLIEALQSGALEVLMDEDLRTFMHFLLEGRVSRLANALGARIGGACGRNAQDRQYTMAPPNSFTVQFDDKGKKRYRCNHKPDCGKLNSFPAYRDQPYARCANTRPFKCDAARCKQAFNIPVDLDAHIATVHAGVIYPTWTCPLCPSTRRCKYRSILNVHIRQKHTALWEQMQAQQATAKIDKWSKNGQKSKAREIHALIYGILASLVWVRLAQVRFFSSED